MTSFRPVCFLVVGLSGVFVATQSVSLVFVMAAISVMMLLSAVAPFAAIVTLLVLAPLRTLIATEARVDFPIDIGQVMLFSFVLSYLINHVIRGVPPLHLIRSPLVYVLLIYVVTVGFSVLGAISITKWFSEWLKWVQLLLVVVLVLELSPGARWEWLVFGLVTAALVNALVGIYEFFGGSGALHLLVDGRFFRAFGTFGSPNPFGGFMGLVLPLSIMAASAYSVRIWEMRRRRTGVSLWDLILPVYYAACSAFLLAGAIASWSRGSWFGLIGAAVVIVVLLPKKRWIGVTLSGLMLGLIALIWISGLVPPALAERVRSSADGFLTFRDVRGVDIDPENYAVIERLAHWQAALNMARDRFWFGVGFGNYEVAYGDYRLLNWSEPLGHAHNYYLNLLAETGIIGFLVYGKVWLSIFVVTWRASYHPDSLARLVVLGLFGSWCYLTIHSLFDNLYVNNLFLHLGLMLGILGVLYHQANNRVRLKVSWGK